MASLECTAWHLSCGIGCSDCWMKLLSVGPTTLGMAPGS